MCVIQYCTTRSRRELLSWRSHRSWMCVEGQSLVVQPSALPDADICAFVMHQQLKDISDTSNGCAGGNSLSATATRFLGKPLNKVRVLPSRVPGIFFFSIANLNLMFVFHVPTENAAVGLGAAPAFQPATRVRSARCVLSRSDCGDHREYDWVRIMNPGAHSWLSLTIIFVSKLCVAARFHSTRVTMLRFCRWRRVWAWKAYRNVLQDASSTSALGRCESRNLKAPNLS